MTNSRWWCKMPSFRAVRYKWSERSSFRAAGYRFIIWGCCLHFPFCFSMSFVFIGFVYISPALLETCRILYFALSGHLGRFFADPQTWFEDILVCLLLGKDPHSRSQRTSYPLIEYMEYSVSLCDQHCMLEDFYLTNIILFSYRKLCVDRQFNHYGACVAC